LRLDRVGRHLFPKGFYERSLETAAKCEEGRVPFPFLVDPIESAVVQLVADVKSEMEVVTKECIVSGGQSLRSRDGTTLPAA
jgi:hypothetical protein